MIGHGQPIGDGERGMRLNEIQEQIGRGQYDVNPRAVADAIVRRLLAELRPAGWDRPPQEECS
ncbi:MAG TPA: flagellar biosynthesis anti-sigma factor FlgM [Solirubrobacteraceae bacterium]